MIKYFLILWSTCRTISFEIIIFQQPRIFSSMHIEEKTIETFKSFKYDVFLIWNTIDAFRSLVYIKVGNQQPAAHSCDASCKHHMSRLQSISHPNLKYFLILWITGWKISVEVIIFRQMWIFSSIPINPKNYKNFKVILNFDVSFIVSFIY
jgi:hypothetical protein